MGAANKGDRRRGGPSFTSLDERQAPPQVGRKSTIGRPRALTDHQVRIVLSEYARFVAWRKLRSTVKSQREIAREFGVSQATIGVAIRSQGQYKQASPENRAAELARRRDRLGERRLRGSR